MNKPIKPVEPLEPERTRVRGTNAVINIPKDKAITLEDLRSVFKDFFDIYSTDGYIKFTDGIGHLDILAIESYRELSDTEYRVQLDLYTQQMVVYDTLMDQYIEDMREFAKKQVDKWSKELEDLS